MVEHRGLEHPLGDLGFHQDPEEASRRWKGDSEPDASTTIYIFVSLSEMPCSWLYSDSSFRRVFSLIGSSGREQLLLKIVYHPSNDYHYKKGKIILNNSVSN